MDEIITETVVDETLENPQKSQVVFDMSKLDKKSRAILEDTEEDDYKFKLDQFEGPLDLLLHLIKITKIDIRDIFLSNITEQYFEIIKNADDLDIEKASEFINMSATLLEIKSKQLLPHDEELGEDDESERFFRRIEEYELLKNQSQKLAEIENVDRLYKAPDNSVGEFRYELPEQLSLNAMIEAFKSIMQKATVKAEVVQEKKIEKDKFTVSQKLSQIKDILLTKDRFKFSEIFENAHSKSEVINTFLALLELLKRQYITVNQTGLFDEIDIIRNDDLNERLTDEIIDEFDGE